MIVYVVSKTPEKETPPCRPAKRETVSFVVATTNKGTSAADITIIDGELD